MDRCIEVVPELAGAEMLQHHVGLRPSRPGGVRLEVDAEGPKGTEVIHNYGHGGAGVTLSWGCGEEVVGLMEKSC
jgi:D-amino-acid oxidase